MLGPATRGRNVLTHPGRNPLVRNINRASGLYGCISLSSGVVEYLPE